METEIITSLAKLIQTADQVQIEIVLLVVILFVVSLFILMTRRIITGWLDTIKSLDSDRAAERRMLQGFLEDSRDSRRSDLERSAAITDSLKEMMKIDLEIYAKIAAFYDNFVRSSEASSASLSEIISKADHNSAVLSEIQKSILVCRDTPQAVAAVLNRRGVVIFQEDGTILSSTPIFKGILGRRDLDKISVKDIINHFFDMGMRPISLESFLAPLLDRPFAFIVRHVDGYLFWCYVHYFVIEKTGDEREIMLIIEVIDWRVLDAVEHVRY